jgi:hypothetical protein
MLSTVASAYHSFKCAILHRCMFVRSRKMLDAQPRSHYVLHAVLVCGVFLRFFLNDCLV